MSYNYAKAALLAQKSIYWAILVKWFLSTYWVLSCCKVWVCKKILADPEISACMGFGHNQTKVAFLAQKMILWEISLLNVPYHDAKFENNP